MMEATSPVCGGLSPPSGSPTVAVLVTAKAATLAQEQGVIEFEIANGEAHVLHEPIICSLESGESFAFGEDFLALYELEFNFVAQRFALELIAVYKDVGANDRLLAFSFGSAEHDGVRVSGCFAFLGGDQPL